MLKTLLYPGTFDPLTLGHLEFIARAHALCERLIVAIGTNYAKGKSLLTTEEKIENLKQETQKLENIKILSFSGLVTNFAKKMGAQAIIRGLRSEDDFKYEQEMAIANRKLSGIETIFLMAATGAAYISSTLIRELAFHGASLKEFIPKDLEKTVHKRIQKEK